MKFNNILLDISNNISYITINRPKQLNALNKETINDLSLAINYSEKSSVVRCIILTGSGEKALCADIKDLGF